jgi:hypothetical protein
MEQMLKEPIDHRVGAAVGLPISRAMTRILLAGLLAVAVGGGAAAQSLDGELRRLPELFKVMADSYGLTAEVYRRCEKKPKMVEELRQNIVQTGEQLQKEVGLKRSFKELARAGFADGMTRGKELDCKDGGQVAADARQTTLTAINQSIKRINELRRSTPPAR